MEQLGGLMIVPIEVSGSQPLGFVLDTGAPFSTLNDAQLARDLNLRARYAGRAYGFAGEAVPLLVAPDVPLRYRGQELLRTELAIHDVRDQLGDHAGRNLDGLLGGELFSHFVVEIEPDSGSVRLHDPGRFRAPEGVSVVRLRIQRGVPLVRARITTEQGRRVRANLLFDTGSETVLGVLSDSHPRLQAPEDARTVRVVGVGGETAAQVATVAKLEVGEVELSGPTTTFFPGESLPSARRIHRLNGVLGSGFVQQFHVWIDYPRQRLLVAPRENGPVTDGFSEVGR